MVLCLNQKTLYWIFIFQNMVAYLFSSTQFLVISMFSDPEGLFEEGGLAFSIQIILDR